MKLKICYPSPRYPHSQIIFRPLVSTLAHRFSFYYYDVIPTGNNLPSIVVNCPIVDSFKSRLKAFLVTV